MAFKLELRLCLIFTNVAFDFQQYCTLEAGPNKQKGHDTRSFSLSLSFAMKWEICQQHQQRHA